MPVHEVDRGGEVDPEVAVGRQMMGDGEVPTSRVLDDLDRVHHVAGIVVHRVPLAGRAAHALHDRSKLGASRIRRWGSGSRCREGGQE
jgi:hypothetical protein